MGTWDKTRKCFLLPIYQESSFLPFKSTGRMWSLRAGWVPHIVGWICFLIQILQSGIQLADLMKGPVQLQERVKHHFLKLFLYTAVLQQVCPYQQLRSQAHPTQPKRKVCAATRLSAEQQKEIRYFNAESSLDLSLLLGNVRKGVNLQSSREFHVLFLIPHTFRQKAGLRL